MWEKFINFALVISFIRGSFSYNIDGSNHTWKIFSPYSTQIEQTLTNPTFFGYDFAILKAPRSGYRLIVGAPKRRGWWSKLPQTGKQRPLGTGNVLNCNTINFESSHKRCSPIRPFPNTTRSDVHGLTIDKFGPSQSLVACAPIKPINCYSESQRRHYSPGYCYRSTNRGRTWSEDPRTREWDCPGYLVDLVFVLDGSNSVGSENFETVKSWVKNVSNHFTTSDGSVRIGVIQYSHFDPRRNLTDQVNIRTEIDLGEFRDQKDFEYEVDDIDLQDYNTYTAHALNYSVIEFMTSRRFKDPKTTKVLVLLTDGNSTDSSYLASSAHYVRSLGITTFAVGVGDARIHELRTIATGDLESDKRVYFVANFSALSVITSQLQNAIQKFALEGSSLGNSSGVMEVLNQEEFSEYGFSVAPSRRSGALYLGAVGAYDWSGTIVKYDTASDNEPDIPLFDQVQKVLPNRTKESYLGYSLSSGFYNGGNTEFLAIGAPRYQLQGAVVVYLPRTSNPNFTDAHTIILRGGMQELGSYFGGSLLSVDLNNDTKDDLLVGAPLYIGNTYDEGRVFVYIAQGTNSPRAWSQASFRPLELKGSSTGGAGGRFGTAMAAAGDLNNDGYNDVIIGAPYQDGNRGAIFVFHGSASGIDTNYKQEIRASTLPNSNLQYFGLSLQGGQDLDGNLYPDVAVGAPKSDTVVILRSRPVAEFQASVAFNTSYINIFSCFRSTERDCLLVTACLRVAGKSVENIIPVKFTITLDDQISNRDSRRVEFRDDPAAGAGTGTTVVHGEKNLTSTSEQCWDYTVYVKKSLSDYSTDIKVTFGYELSESHTSKPLSPVRDPSKSNTTSHVTKFATNCGGDSKCDYDLSISTSELVLPEATLINGINTTELLASGGDLANVGKDLTNGGKYLIISQETSSSSILVKVNLTNRANESAFDVRVNVSYSSQLRWNNIARIISSNTATSGGRDCILSTELESDTQPLKSRVLNYRYDSSLGNIMPEDAWCYFEFNLLPNSLSESGSVEDVTVRVSAYTEDGIGITNDIQKDNNDWSMTVPVRYRADATVTERSQITAVRFNFTTKNETLSSVQQIGPGTPAVRIRYEINGRGYSNIPISTASLRFPFSIPGEDAKHLLYPIDYECDSLQGDASCECDTSVINPYNLLLSGNNSQPSNITLTPNQDTINESTTYDCSAAGNEQEGLCRSFNCTIQNLGAQDTIRFSVFFRLWTHSLNLVNNSEITLLSGFRYSTEESTLLVNDKGENRTVFTSTWSTTTRLYTPPETIEVTNNIWIYIVAAIGGLLLLIIIIIILWKTGFFKSKYGEMKEQLEWTEANNDAGGNGAAP